MIKFNKFNVTNGAVKARVHYSLDNHVNGKPCVWLFAKDYDAGDLLAQIIPDAYVNNTESQSDYFEKGRVVLFEDHPLYGAARAAVEGRNAPPVPQPAETISLINGNHHPYTLGLPLLVIQGFMNDGGLAHILENTGLDFQKGAWDNYSAQPTSSNQIAALFLTYNFKTRYFNNGDTKNTLFLKSDHHIGFQVDSICLECVKRNHIHAGSLQPGDHLSC